MDWFQCIHPRPSAKLRLFAFPYAGGGASIFRTWGAALPPEIELVAIQLPGREGRFREAPHTRYATLIGPLKDAIATRASLPMAFFGYSLGATIAFEVARAMRGVPRALCVAARVAPHFPVDRAPMADLPEAAFIREVGERYQPIPDAILAERDLLAMLLPTLRADMKMVETATFQPDTPLDIPIFAFGGTRDRHATRAQLEAWAQHTTVGFELTMIEGDHFFLNDPVAKAALLGQLGRKLITSSASAQPN